METKFITIKREKVEALGHAIWDQHKAELIHQYQQGGRRGVAQAVEWAHSQNIPGFKPK
jgi:hypothetical protein